MHASIYIFYMVLFTGLAAFCIFLWAVSEDDDAGEASKDDEDE